MSSSHETGGGIFKLFRDDPAVFSKLASVTVLVGAERIKYTLPKQLICAQLPLLAMSFQAEGRDESDEILLTPVAEITLRGIEEESFDMVVTWLYRAELSSAMDKWSASQWIEMYKTANTLEMETLKNNVMDKFRAIQARSNVTFSLSYVDQLPRDVAGLEPMREYLLLTNARSYNLTYNYWSKQNDQARTMGQVSEATHKEFREMAAKYKQKKVSAFPHQMTGCVFHDHSKGSWCPHPQNTQTSNAW